MNELSQAEVAMLRNLQGRGFAVAIFTPTETGDASPEAIEDAMIGAGWSVINEGEK